MPPGTYFNLALLLLATAVAVFGDRVVIDEPLGIFLGTLERYANTKNDVVFLLDESGSIGADKFPQVKLFAKLTAQRLAVSADHSRIAVVTFATDTIPHIDYIKDPYGNNMCTLLREIDKIGYAAEWTHTDKAMLEAERIFAQARPDSNKLIVLLTDGQSNAGHSPIRIAGTLKSRGIIIFAIGVADVNVAEINAVATSPEHIYILTNFDYITKVNIYLVNDTKEISMDLAKDPSLCDSLCTDNDDCCDKNANCYCGTRTGKYECACNAGYHGRGGYKGQCHKCPRGTYKSKSRNSECISCPQHSTTKKAGSTSVKDCVCEAGYERFSDICFPKKCAVLNAPEGGILVPTYCNNTYGNQCSFKCREGYCPYSCEALQPANQLPTVVQSRACLDTGKWSGQEFHCEKMTCPSLHFPNRGHHNCSERDFTFGTTCSFRCDKGYELSGSKSRTCLFDKWTGNETTCKVIYCDALKTNALLQLKHSTCRAKPMPYGSTCQYHCANGYVLMLHGNETDGSLTCEHNGKWSEGYKSITCKDKSPPKVHCPKSIVIDAEPTKGFARVEWDFPKATDNVPGTVKSIRLQHPKTLQKALSKQKGKVAYIFPIGNHKVVYEATDHSNLTGSCPFTVDVLDKEPPQVVYCPADIEKYHGYSDSIAVTWDEPIFEDNSKKINVTKTRSSGNKFGWGPVETVVYTARDAANYTDTCKFQVKIKHYPCPYYDPPTNGIVTCDNWQDGRMCSVFCHDGFQFASGKNVIRTYICNNRKKSDGTFEPVWEAFGVAKFEMPWPDCSRKQKPNSLSVTVAFNYSVDSCSEEALKNFRKKFFSLPAFKSSAFCPPNANCSPENVNVTCNPASLRRRRSLRHSLYDMEEASVRGRRDTPEQILNIHFNVQVYPNATEEDIPVKPAHEPGEENEIDLSSSSFMKDLEDTISLRVKDTYNLTDVPEPKKQYDVIVVCSVGQISVNSSCVNCPAGTYKEDVSETCIACPSATYQDEERQLSCKSCPVGFTTHQVKSKSEEDCKGPCQPGTHSETTFEPCLACPFGTYQERAARKECMKCPAGQYTWRVGANSSSDCAAPCKAGAFSGTGYEPCAPCDIGWYQDQEGQTNCTICPNRTTTTSNGAKSNGDCREFDICAERRPCEHDAPCVQLDKDYECQCPDGLRGRNCEINLDDCASAPCLNNGTCVDEIGNFTCSCPDGWTGQQCETNIDDCYPNPCFNGGACVDELNSYECKCEPGFSGNRCEKNIYECESNPCLNNGTCFDMQNGYRCCCTKDYYGPNCERLLVSDICDTVHCENGGTCGISGEDEFICTCPPGFEGELCGHNIDDCLGHQCDNGGICVDGIGNATCSCPQRFTGSRCEEALKHEYTLTFPAPSTSNFVEVNNVHRLYAVTVAFFMRTSNQDPNSRGTPVSYSYMYDYHVVDNALTLMDANSFVLYIQGQTFHTEFSGNKDNLWHHYAITWEKMGGKWSFFADGKSIKSGQGVGVDEYMHPGIFVLGQEQDDLGSSFSALEAFAGDITEFNVWDYAMTPEEIERVSKSCGYVGNVIPWYSVSQYISGDVQISESVDKCQALGPCSTDSCDCFYTSQTKENSCKHLVESCDSNTCSYGQPCVPNGQNFLCNCSAEFEGRRCEYDVDECLDKKGGCQFTCENDVGTGSYHCSCPYDMFLSEDGKGCKDTGYCLTDGETYVNGETWVKDCRNCLCDRGKVHCEDIHCNETVCHPEETLLKSPGECCPKCIAWAFCLIYPQNTLMTFDLSKYQVDGSCNYTAIEDCIEGRFKIQVEFPPNRTDLVIYQDCKKLTISSDGSLFVDDRAVEVPFKNEEWSIDEQNSTVFIKTNSDFMVEWNFTSEAVIAIPITQADKMCGLCSRIEEYYTYNSGKINLSDRWASGENECFIISEDYVESIIVSLAVFPSPRMIPVFLLIALLKYIEVKFLT